MPAIPARQLRAQLQSITYLRGVGDHSWESLFPDDEVLNLTNINPVVDRIWRSCTPSPSDAELRFVDQLDDYDMIPDPGSGDLFLRRRNPSQEHGVYPGTIDLNLMKKHGIQVTQSDDRYVALDAPETLKFSGPQGRIILRGEFTSKWYIKGNGPAKFELFELSDYKVPWVSYPRASESLSYGDKPFEQRFTPLLKSPKTWWKLVVTAAGDKASDYYASPFWL